MVERAPELDLLDVESLRRLHRGVLEGPDAVIKFFYGLKDARTVLWNGVNRRSAPRVARVTRVTAERIVLNSENIDPTRQPQIFFNCEHLGIPYFFVAKALAVTGDGSVEIGLPSVVYEAERRDITRSRGPADAGQRPGRVEIHGVGRTGVIGSVTDWSYSGLGVRVPDSLAATVNSQVRLKFLDGSRRGEKAFASIRHEMVDSAGWKKLGLAVTQVPSGKPVPVDRRRGILSRTAASSAWHRLRLAGAVASSAPRQIMSRIGQGGGQPKVQVLEYFNESGEPIRAIVDQDGTRRGGNVVVIPPAWGQTKETLSPLAEVILATFAKASEPVAVVRFDGTHRRGESFIAPEFRSPGDEYLGFTFSRGVGDIAATVDYVDRQFKPSKIVLVTFSLAAVEGRRAMALDHGSKIDGWISVVGMVDLQSGLRSVSGGVDYAHGLVQGMRFGRHELVGVVADMDRTGKDALENKLVFFEDARRDMGVIKVPVTWIHGRHDAWIEVDRVRDLLSSGDSSQRRLIEIDAGHRMRSSVHAMEAFQLIAQEVGRIATGRPIEPALPDLAQMERRQRAERERRPSPMIEIRKFWEDYLLGSDRRLGIELMTSTSAYHDLMATQIARLGLEEGRDPVIDLGAGTGDFLLQCAESSRWTPRVVAVDFVFEALRRGRERAIGHELAGATVGCILGNCELSAEEGLPIASSAADAVIASLLISYVNEPERLVAEVFRILRPGGRFVASSLVPDADISKIYREGIAELPPEQVAEIFGPEQAAHFDTMQRQFLNNASRLLSLEEAGRFRFWGGDELASLFEAAGFTEISTDFAFGSPPQAVIVTGRRGR